MTNNALKVLPEEGVGNVSKAIGMYWFDKGENSCLPAGVAFYDEKFGEYRLKIDIHPETTYYLRPVAQNDTQTHYRAEVVIKQNGKFKCRRPIGSARKDSSGNGDIFINFGPYSRLLVMNEGDCGHE